MSEKSKPRILCVDDEPNVLEGLSLNLRRRFEVFTAGSGADGLALLAREADMQVVISDMRMPNMDGATFLTRAREQFPDTVRILLTGQADLQSAISAVNNGQIFRFLTKPCAPPDMLAQVSGAVEQHRLITSERVLLRQTLQGSIKALVDVLALTHPASFGRAMRIKEKVGKLVAAVGMAECWQVEVAAMLSQLGCAALPPEVAEKVYFGRRLIPEEEAMVARIPHVTEQLLGNIPRMEAVRHMLAGLHRPLGREVGGTDAERELVATGAKLLRIVMDYDVLEQQGATPPVAFAAMRARNGRYEPELLEKFAEVRGDGGPHPDVRELSLRDLMPGMVVAQDVVMSTGALLVARGYQLTDGVLERLRNFRAGSVREPIRVNSRSK